MRLPNLVRASGGALLLALLSGCAPSDAAAPPEPTSTFVAPYATDEEALAAAEEAYAEYLRVINYHLHESVVDEALLATVAVGDELEGAIQSHKRMAQEGKYTEGEVTFRDMVLQRFSPSSSSSELVSVYLCEDLSKIRLFASDGTRVDAEAVEPYTLQVTFDYSSESDALLVSDRLEWESTC